VDLQHAGSVSLSDVPGFSASHALALWISARSPLVVDFTFSAKARMPSSVEKSA
jgi:hypothetical protein